MDFLDVLKILETRATPTLAQDCTGAAALSGHPFAVPVKTGGGISASNLRIGR
jgi:hypothetical protein